MKMKNGWMAFGIIICALCCISFVSAETQPQTPATDQAQTNVSSNQPDHEALVKEKCAACHGLKKVCSEIGKIDKAEWEKIITRMAERGQKKNIIIDADQQKTMVEYLTTLQDKTSLCTTKK
ncbi:MAG: hypothetical protein HQK77_09470 [Desulfobacterales bacterium]|nr:hypothetical protein [Desulfobacterales bacterium]